jgi:hypothetical protein
LLLTCDRIGPDTDLRLDRLRHSIYIDDLILLTTDDDGEDARVAMLQYLDACAVHFGWVVKVAKTVWPTIDGADCLGIYVWGRGFLATVHPSKLRALCETTLKIVRSGSASEDAIRSIVGSWTWAMLVRRPSLSVFDKVFAFMRVAGSGSSLWPSVITELLVAIGLAPLLVANLRSNPFPKIGAVDASSLGCGVVAAAVGQRTVDALLYLPPQLVVPDFVLRDTIPGVDSALWRTIASYRWQRPAHINTLELHALLTILDWFASHPSSVHAQFLCLSDSSAVLGAVRKGRSSRPAFRAGVRRVAAILFAADAYLDLWWVASKHNASDRPSRNFPDLGPDVGGSED